MMKPMYEAPSVGSMIQKKIEFDFSKILDLRNFPLCAEKSKMKAQLALVSAQSSF